MAVALQNQLADEYPYQILDPQEGVHGMGILSQYPLIVSASWYEGERVHLYPLFGDEGPFGIVGFIAQKKYISGRKAFQRPMEEGIQLLNSIQDVYLCRDITIV